LGFAQADTKATVLRTISIGLAYRRAAVVPAVSADAVDYISFFIAAEEQLFTCKRVEWQRIDISWAKVV
jgi:hypothetical protein